LHNTRNRYIDSQRTMKKVLILGGAGFIGGNLSRALVKSGIPTTIFTRPTASLGRIQDILDDVELIYGDFLDDSTLEEAINGVDVVFHLISTTFPNRKEKSSVYDVLSNLLPTIRLIEMCLENNVKKIVYASSGGTVYGEPQSNLISETQTLLPKSAYGQSKLTIENYLNFYARTTNLDINILRISNPFGPGQHSWRVQGIVAVAIGCLLHKRTLQIYGEGETVRDYIYIDDVIEAMLLIASSSGSSIVNISSGKGYSILDIVHKIESLTSQIIDKQFISSRPGDVRVNVLSNQKAFDLYGWKPHISLDEGLEITLDWLSCNLS
jgi:UDP-glucose 4-epimerase